MIFQYINVCPVPREMLKTSAYGFGFQHLPRDLANVNAWNTMFDPYINNVSVNNAFFTLKGIKSHLKGSYDKQNFTLVVISYEIYETRRRLVS